MFASVNMVKRKSRPQTERVVKTIVVSNQIVAGSIPAVPASYHTMKTLNAIDGILAGIADRYDDVKFNRYETAYAIIDNINIVRVWVDDVCNEGCLVTHGSATFADRLSDLLCWLFHFDIPLNRNRIRTPMIGGENLFKNEYEAYLVLKLCNIYDFIEERGVSASDDDALLIFVKRFKIMVERKLYDQTGTKKISILFDSCKKWLCKRSDKSWRNPN